MRKPSISDSIAIVSSLLIMIVGIISLLLHQPQEATAWFALGIFTSVFAIELDLKKKG